VPLLDTSGWTKLYHVFKGCKSLTTIPEWDLRNIYSISSFSDCVALTDVRFRNIQRNLSLSSSPLLTVDSLVHLIYELRNQKYSSNTLTIGTTNLEKLANVYVKLVDITDEMREKDDLIDEKYPFVVCDSTDEGATLITTYISSKNWALK
jgi:hypothetical protein